MESPASQEPALVYSIVGERVALGPLRRALLSTYQRWYNDFTMRRTFGGWSPWTAERQARWFEQVADLDRSEVMFTISARSGDRLVGTTTLTGIDERNGSAEFAILIGEPDARGKGYGTETTRLMLDYAFTALGLNSVWLQVYAFNLAGIRAYTKAGFREVARLRERHLMGGRLWDVILMDCLATEFTSPVPGRVLVPNLPRPDSPRCRTDKR